MVFFKLLFRDNKTTNLNTPQNESIKFALLDTPFFSFDTFNKKKPKSNLKAHS